MGFDPRTIPVFLILLAVLVFFHELGHFLLAKLFKMRVEEFAIGFGKRLVRVGFDGQTEYTIRMLPLGGFVRIAGMEIEDQMERRLTGDASESTNTALLHQEEAEVDGAVKDGFNDRPVLQRFLVILAGPVFSVALAWLVFAIVAATSGVPDPGHAPISVGSVVAGGIADKAGIKANDVILAVDGQPTRGNEAVMIIRRSIGKPLRLTLRNGPNTSAPTREVTVTPAAENDQGERIGRIGIALAPSPLFRRVSLGEAIRPDNWYMRDSFKGLGRLFRGKEDVRENVGGPIKIVQVTNAAVQVGGPSPLLLLAGLSLSIGLFNLLPIPILDGGHLVLLTLEAVRRRKLTAEQTQRVLTAGLAVIALLFVLVMFNDFTSLPGIKKLLGGG